MWLGDDTAVLGGGLLFATDVMAEGVHFDLGFSSPADAGWKALAVNCSDLAAMGGAPRAAVAAVVVPAGRQYLASTAGGSGVADAVAAGLAEAAGSFGCPLVGGDTVVGESLVISVAVLGDSPAGGAVLRSGARPGDAVFVTGSLGGPRAALHALWRGESPDPAAVVRLHRPVPRLAEGSVAAASGATAMIDLSDGLSSDLGHILRASSAGARIEAAAVPCGPGATLGDALAGGDDYELCFTAADSRRVSDAFAAAGLAAPVRIGRIVDGTGIVVVDADGAERELTAGGFEHDVA